jgi:hypothetical protein
MYNFEHFSICNKGEKEIFLWNTKTFGSPFMYLGQSKSSGGGIVAAYRKLWDTFLLK